MATFDKMKEDVRETLTGSTPENDLRARLHADHNEVSKLIDEFLASSDYEIAMREDLRDQIVVGLTSHAKAEEEVVYDFLTREIALQGKIEHSLQEHAEIDRMVDLVKTMDCGDPGMNDVVKDLKTTVLHHVHDEENELLPKAEEVCGQEKLARLIPAFNTRRMQLLNELERSRSRMDETTGSSIGDNPLGETSSQF